eukprot:5752989-Prymnesium_polylepis.1
MYDSPAGRLCPATTMSPQPCPRGAYVRAPWNRFGPNLSHVTHRLSEMHPCHAVSARQRGVDPVRRRSLLGLRQPRRGR